MFRRILLILALAASVGFADDATLGAQTKLKRLGFYTGELDGQYGSQTAAAIRRYQVAQNLRVTGELNAQTMRSLGLKASPPPTRQPDVPQYVAIADIFKGGPFITAPTEVQIATIAQGQRSLKLLGYYRGPIDGRVTPDLVASLKAWQKSARFRQTGRFDESTLKGLNLMPN